MSISHTAFVMYPVSDLERSATFYRDVLGLAPTDFASPAWMEFDVAGTTFGIGNFEQIGKPGTAQSLALEIAGLDGFLSDLKAKGATVSDPHDLPICRIARVEDPAGNAIVLHEKKAGAP